MIPLILGGNHDGDLELDLERLIGSHACIVANSGGGKSGLIRRMLEVTHGQIQHIVLDIEDEFYTLRERFDYVIAGGDGGDAPATLDNAAGLAIAALTHGFSLIVQLNDLGEDAPEFVAQFLAGLMSAPRELWHPVLVVLDEAQRFVPASGATEATKPVKDLLQRGRKRGFTALLASLRISEINPGVRGLVNNWMLGRVGQALDRDTMAGQLGFSAREGRQRLQSIPPRNFWAFGPALADEPLLFHVADVSTTPVKPGQAKVATPPPPEALRAILCGLAKVDQPAGDGSDLVHPAGAENRAISGAVEEIAALRARIVHLEREQETWIVDRAYGQQQLDALVDENRALREVTARIQDAAADLARIRPAFVEVAAGDNAQAVSNHGGDDVDRSAARAPVEPEAPAPTGQRQVTEPGASTPPSPAALAIADLLDRVNPAKLTWSQAAAMTGRKASGGNFNSARKWLRSSGRIVEDGEFIWSAAHAPAGMTRAEALDLWRSVLTNPAPRMIDAFDAGGALTKDELGAAIGAQPRGGNFNNGLAQLRRNGLLYECGSGSLRLVEPLPGEKA